MRTRECHCGALRLRNEMGRAAEGATRCKKKEKKGKNEYWVLRAE
jgi:hypothetical protein